MTGKLLELVSEDPIEFAKCLGAGKMGSGKGSSSGVKVETPKKLLCCLFEGNGDLSMNVHTKLWFVFLPEFDITRRSQILFFFLISGFF